MKYISTILGLLLAFSLTTEAVNSKPASHFIIADGGAWYEYVMSQSPVLKNYEPRYDFIIHSAKQEVAKIFPGRTLRLSKIERHGRLKGWFMVKLEEQFPPRFRKRIAVVIPVSSVGVVPVRSPVNISKINEVNS